MSVDDDDDIEAIIIDEVIDAMDIGEPEQFALVLRSGSGFTGLVFTPELARIAAAALLRGAEMIEGR